MNVLGPRVVCQQQFITRGELKQHSARRHERVKPYVCSECQMRFCTSYVLSDIIISDFLWFM